MSAICLIVAGVVRATLPHAEFTLAWDHSVEKTRWEERYRPEGTALVLVEARVKGSGAGMEPPPEAMLRNGWWTWAPHTTFAELRLTRSSYARDYTVCGGGRCSELGRLVGPTRQGEVVVFKSCMPVADQRSSGPR
ncbi:MAG: DUF1850 domain-containing protein [Betaproteobacteria bacterium]